MGSRRSVGRTGQHGGAVAHGVGAALPPHLQSWAFVGLVPSRDSSPRAGQVPLPALAGLRAGHGLRCPGSFLSSSSGCGCCRECVNGPGNSTGQRGGRDRRRSSMSHSWEGKGGSSPESQGCQRGRCPCRAASRECRGRSVCHGLFHACPPAHHPGSTARCTSQHVHSQVEEPWARAGHPAFTALLSPPLCEVGSGACGDATYLVLGRGWGGWCLI